MPKKNTTRPRAVESALVTAAKTIGKAAGKVAFVLSAAAHRKTEPAARRSQPHRPAKKTTVRASKTGQSKPVNKTASTRRAASTRKSAAMKTARKK